LNRLGHFVGLCALAVAISSCGGGGSSNGGGLPPPAPDFAFSVSPNSGTVSPGGALLAQVSVTAENGFAGSVTNIVSGLPAGATVSPSSPFTMAPGSQNVILNVPSNAAQGSSTVTLQASSGSLQHSTNVAVQVQAQQFASFSVTLNGSELSFAQGGTANIGVGLGLSSNGSPNYEVQFSVSGLPSGVQATFSNNPYVATQSGTLLTLAASSSSGLANYATITVTATRTPDGVQESGQLILNVTPPVGTLPAIRTDFVRMDGTPSAAAYDPVHNLVYASNAQWNRVAVISSDTHQIVNSIAAPSPTGMDMSLDGKHILVGSTVQQLVSIDTTTLQIVQRTSVPRQAGIPDLLANMSNGTTLVGMTNNSSPPSYLLEQWNPAAGTFTPLAAPGIGPWISQLVRTGDGEKALVVDYSTGVNIAVYDSASDTFTASGPFAGGVLGVAASPTSHQFAIVGGATGLAFLDTSLDILATPSLGGIFWGMAYSPDGTKLYVSETLVSSVNGAFYPVILTYDTSAFSLLGVAPAFQTFSYAVSGSPYAQAVPLAADSTGLVYSAFSHGLVLDDPTNYQNVLNLPFGPPLPQVSETDEAALNNGLATGMGGLAIFDVTPDVWFGTLRGTNIQLSGSSVSMTAPPSPDAGIVNVKAVLPNGWFFLAPQSFSYGSQILSLGGNAGSPQGGASLALIGYGLIGNDGTNPTVTIGGHAASVTNANKWVDFTYGGVGPLYPFPDIDQVVVTVPPGSPGTVDVVVTSSAGTATLTNSFTYLQGVNDYASPDTFTYVLYDSQRHWVYLTAGDHIDVFSVDTAQFLAPIVPPTISGKKQFQGLALTPDHSKLLVANGSDFSVTIVDPDNPSSASIVKVGLPTGFGPYAVAATSTGKAFVTTDSCDGGGTYVVDLSSLNVTMPWPGCSGSTLWSTASGAYVLEDGSLWSAATNQWTGASGPGSTSNAASGDGYWFSFGYTRFDTQMISHLQAQIPEFFSALLTIRAWAGEKMNASGSLLYTPVPQALTTAESNGIEITDTNLGTMLGQILLAEQIQGPPVQVPVDFDETGNRLFLITSKGLTVVNLAPPPLSIGYLNPATGSTSGGTAVTIRGSGFKSGATVSFAGTTTTATFVDGSTLDIATPPGSAGSVRVSIQNPDGTSYSLDAGFTYQ
jgi:hypothetical protein